LPNSPFTNIDVTTANVGLDGTKIDLCKFLDEEASQIFNEALKQIDTTTLDQGAYPLRLGKTKTFAENQLIINGDDIAELRLDVSVSLLVHKPCRGDEIA
jgi:RNA binding exosome subunit